MKTKKNQKRAIRSKWFVVLSAAVLMHAKMFENVFVLLATLAPVFLSSSPPWFNI